MSKQTAVLVDFDGLLYMSGRDTLDESISSLQEKVDNILQKTNASFWVGFITVGRCFRYSVSEDYKKNRVGKDKPKWFKALREWATTEYNLVTCDKYEADDIVTYLYNQNLCVSDYHIESREMFESALDLCKSDKMPEFTWEELNVIIASPDKDITSIVPKCFNYTYKLADKNNPDSVVKGWFTEMKECDIGSFTKQQMIVG